LQNQDTQKKANEQQVLCINLRQAYQRPKWAPDLSRAFTAVAETAAVGAFTTTQQGKNGAQSAALRFDKLSYLSRPVALALLLLLLLVLSMSPSPAQEGPPHTLNPTAASAAALCLDWLIASRCGTQQGMQSSFGRRRTIAEKNTSRHVLNRALSHLSQPVAFSLLLLMLLLSGPSMTPNKAPEGLPQTQALLLLLPV
jgi:hypothetical protein